MFGDDFQGLFQGSHIRSPVPYISEGLFQIVALNVYHHDIRELQDVIAKGCNEGLFLMYTTVNHWGNCRIFGFHRRDTPVQQGDFPVAARAGPLHADDKLRGVAFSIFSISYHRGHHRPHKSHTHDHHNLAPQGALVADYFFHALEFFFILLGAWQLKLLPIRTERIINRHVRPPGIVFLNSLKQF